IRNGLAVVEDPVQALERQVTVHSLKNVQETRDAFVVGCVQPERPFVSREQRDDFLEFIFETARKIGTRLKKVFEIGGTEHEHFTCAVAAEKVIAFTRSG